MTLVRLPARIRSSRNSICFLCFLGGVSVRPLTELVEMIEIYVVNVRHADEHNDALGDVAVAQEDVSHVQKA